jgi:hypothetical protein
MSIPVLMRPSPLRPSWIGIAAMVVLSGALLTGCASRGGSANRPSPQPLLFGKSSFFDGAIVAEATLGPFRLNPAGGALDRRTPGPEEGEPIPVNRGGFGQRGGSDMGMGFPRGPGEEGAFGGGPGGPPGGRGGPGGGGLGGMPRQTLVITFRSLAGEPLPVGVVEVKSAIGNFVPVPEQFTLAPGGAQELEAMRASYPAAIDELEVLVALRVSGREETRVVRLQLAAPKQAP